MFFSLDAFIFRIFYQKRLRNFGVSLLCFVGMAGALWAQSSNQSSVVDSTVVRVNGVAITEQALHTTLTNLQSHGVAMTPQLREQVIGELIVRELMLAEFTRLKLDARPDYQQSLHEVQQRLRLDTLFNDYLANHPLSEAEERAEYARQKEGLGGSDTTPQYLLSQIVVKTELEARDIIARAQKGEPFDKLALQSLDEASKKNGGQVGWVFPRDIVPSIGAVIANLSKSTLAAAPIPTAAGWHVVRVDDIRAFKLPSFEDARPQLRQALLVQRRQALIEGLLKTADIKRP